MENREILPNYFICKPLTGEPDNGIYILHTGLPEWFGKIVPAQSSSEPHQVQYFMKGKENELDSFAESEMEIMSILKADGLLPADVNG